MQYHVTFYVPSTDPKRKRERLGSATVDAPDARAALPVATKVLEGAPPEVKARIPSINEIRVQQVEAGAVRWVKKGNASAKKGNK